MRPLCGKYGSKHRSGFKLCLLEWNLYYLKEINDKKVK